MTEQWFGLNAYRPRGPFIDFHNRRQRWAVMVAHRRAGKTVACVADLIYGALLTRKQDARYAYVAPQYNQAKDIAWLYVKRLTADIPGVSYNEAELRANLPNGAQVRLYGADNPDRLRGMYLDGVILDEHADMRPRVWGEIVRPMLSDRKGWAAFIGTPKGHNEFHRVWQDAANEPEWFRLMLRGSESGLIDQGELDAMRKSMTEDQYAQEVECSFEAAIQGAILGRYMTAAEAEGRIRSVEYDPQGAGIQISSDIGYHDTASWWFWQPKHGGFALVDYDEGNGMDATEWAERLAARCVDRDYKLERIHLPHDARAKTFAAKRSAVEQFVAVFGMAKLRVVPISKKADQINAARRIVTQCEFDAKRCADGIEALKQWRFKWDEDRKEFSKEPEHDWASHPGDAFAYGAQVMQQLVTEPAPAKGKTIHTITLDELYEHHERDMAIERRI
jgi:phage terminase large subunit